jgi:hypothetical protein
MRHSDRFSIIWVIPDDPSEWSGDAGGTGAARLANQLPRQPLVSTVGARIELRHPVWMDLFAVHRNGGEHPLLAAQLSPDCDHGVVFRLVDGQHRFEAGGPSVAPARQPPNRAFGTSGPVPARDGGDHERVRSHGGREQCRRGHAADISGVRGVPRHRRRMGAPPPVPHLRARRVLRLVPGPARFQALPPDDAPCHPLLPAR